jgi:acetyl esterase
LPVSLLKEKGKMSEALQPEDPVLDVDRRADGPGTTRIDAADPAAPMYQLLAKLRKPVALRDIMIRPVREGYAGQDLPDVATVLPPWEHLFPGQIVNEVRVLSSAGPIRCQVYRPDAGSTPRPVVVYCHGGGFMVGSSEDTDYMTRRICSVANVIVVSVNYRLAPEWPFPTGLDDCVEVYQWARSHAREIGGDPSRVGVAGDSSGGNFAAALSLRARDRDLPAPDAVVMFGPVLDFCFEEYESFERLAAAGVVFDAAFLGFARGAYCRYAEWRHPHASPIRGDLSGYPPSFLAVGTHDPLIDSCRAFAATLEASSKPRVRLAVVEGMPHGFYFWPGIFPRQEADIYSEVADFLDRHLTGKS